MKYSRNIAHKLLAGEFLCDQSPGDVFSDSRYSEFAETLVTSARLREYTLAFRYRSMTWSTTEKRVQPLVAFGPTSSVREAAAAPKSRVEPHHALVTFTLFRACLGHVSDGLQLSKSRYRARAHCKHQQSRSLWDTLASSEEHAREARFLQALQGCRQHIRAPFCCPGHHGVPGRHWPPFEALLTQEREALLTHDLAEQPELDNLQQPSGVLLEAQERAAAVYETARTFFLVNGSTSGILAALLAACSQRATDPSHCYALIPRNAHQSVFHALALTGLHPVYLSPRCADARYQIIGPVETTTVEAALAALAPRVAVVVLTSPTYHGHVGDVSRIATLCRQYGALLVVDEAHGAHLGLYPQLPPSARQLGADLVVQSTHKTLLALTQAAMLHVPFGSQVAPEAVADAVRMVSSTSPNAVALGES
ncbi:hypothetical protein F1559_000305 [Cyanidiococcus yangmingshanensis]|uniref:Orn/Lys/Arg decarboxylases family 1 pyridoxal-P attachment site domain-containing protein n=1 Tax=Cyanidiococcus yangmingshanensis TaxID=2690220 RepID=A0A7J7INK2_9RHOD|nr:hypothetical protein F1559_000305 [Cyanidiococcus yangmingshanensis]